MLNFTVPKKGEFCEYETLNNFESKIVVQYCLIFKFISLIL